MTTKTLHIASFSTGFPGNVQHLSGLIGLIADAVYEVSIRRVLRGIIRTA